MAMVAVVVYDACVLFPAPLRDILIRIAQAGVVRARWTDDILDECFRGVQRHRPDISAERLIRTRTLMNHALRDVLITDYHSLIPSLVLPDPDDRHVLAAAIHANAQTIVTFNLADFPAPILAEFDIEALHPDAFLCDAIARAPGKVFAAFSEQARALRNPPMTLRALLETLARQGLQGTVGALREMLTIS